MGYKRDEILTRLRSELKKGRLLVGAGAGTGISAKFEEEGGADIIMVFSSGRFRMAGFSSLAGWLAYGNANEIALELGERHVLPVVKNAPVVCGLNGTDPTYRIENLVHRVVETGFSGICNFPTLGMIDGKFRTALEETGISYNAEVRMIEYARSLDIFTMAFAFNAAEAEKMVKAGCDVLIPHVGLTTGGSTGAKKSIDMERAVQLTGEMYRVAKSINSEVLVFCHGGPISRPDDVSKVLKEVPVEGFVGASSTERLPVEEPIKNTMKAFKSIKINMPQS